MLETVGKKLAKARKAKRLTIEDVEHRTCIPHGRLRELEDDDYSHFANLTYAKNFLKLYSNYLGVDTAEYRQELSLYEVDDFGSDPLANEFAAAEGPKRKAGGGLGFVFLLLVAVGGGYFYFDHYIKSKEGGGKDSSVVEGAGEGIAGGGDTGRAAEPPGEVNEDARDPVPEEVAVPAPVEAATPVPAEIDAPVPAEIRNPVPAPGEGTVMLIGGEELPVLPAEVIEDDELEAGEEGMPAEND